MVTITEDNIKVAGSSASLKKIVDTLIKIKICVSALERALIVVQLSKLKFKEGTPEDKRRVNNLINELQRLLFDLDNLEIDLNQTILVSRQEAQGLLNNARTTITAISQTMQSIWEMRNTGETEEGNQN